MVTGVGGVERTKQAWCSRCSLADATLRNPRVCVQRVYVGLRPSSLPMDYLTQNIPSKKATSALNYLLRMLTF